MLQQEPAITIDVSDLSPEIVNALRALVEAIRVQDYNQKELIRRASEGILQKEGKVLRPVTRENMYGDVD